MKISSYTPTGVVPSDTHSDITNLFMFVIPKVLDPEIVYSLTLEISIWDFAAWVIKSLLMHPKTVYFQNISHYFEC